MNRQSPKLTSAGAGLALAGLLALGACGSAPPPRHQTSASAAQSAACPSYLSDTTMNVVHAPGRVIVVWQVESSLFGDTAPAEKYIRRLAKHVAAELVSTYPGSTTIHAQEPQKAGFTLSNANIEYLDQVRTELDRAVERFEDGTCRGLITKRRHPAKSLATASR